MMLKQFDTKERSILFAALVGCIALLYLLFDDSILTDSFSDSDAQVIGKLSYAAGDVRHKNSKDFQWKTAKQERKIFWGDGVFTGGNSKAHVDLLSGGRLELDPNSLVILTPTQKDLTLDLRFGNFKGDLKGQDLKVKVGDEVLTVSGNKTGETSVVEFGRDKNQNLVINVVKGSVDVKSSTSGSRQIASGKNAKISADGKSVAESASTGSILRKTASGTEETAKPIRKRAIWKDNASQQKMAVQLDENGQPTTKPIVDLNWVPADESGPTIVELSKDPNFSSIIMTKTADGTNLRMEVESSGVYYARVKPASDQEAPWSPTQKIEIQGLAMPPVGSPELVADKLFIDPEQTNKARIQWKSADRADNYVVEYAKDPDFKEITETQKTKDPGLDFVANRPGKTYFRVRGVSAGGKEGLVSPVGQITVPNRALSLNPVESREVFGKSPKAPPETIDVKVSWTQLKTAPQYEVQLSKDAEFKKEVKKFVTPTNSGALKVSDPGQYHVRIRPLGADKKPTGRFTETQSFDYTYKIPLAQPVLVEPMANSTVFFQDSEGPFWFTWKKVRQAELYELEVATDSEFKNKIVSKQTANSRYLFADKVPSGQLYWRVRASNPERQSHWSEPRAVKIFSGRRAGEVD